MNQKFLGKILMISATLLAWFSLGPPGSPQASRRSQPFPLELLVP